ncbi:MAG TPA: hypothetical protein PK671_11320, partial [Candidatus Obscuribacter sp.]|nr:hypothetical protein [Candidatus Obscuribacter sp.]
MPILKEFINLFSRLFNPRQFFIDDSGGCDCDCGSDCSDCGSDSCESNSPQSRALASDCCGDVCDSSSDGSSASCKSRGNSANLSAPPPARKRRQRRPDEL